MKGSDMRRKSFEKIGNIILCVLSVFLCLGLPAAGLAGRLLYGEGETGNGENRVLAEFPVIREAGDLLTFPERFEKWFSDHLFFKSRLVELDSELKIRLFGELDSDRVILGTEKPWLFHCSDDGQPLETYKRINRFSEAELEKIAANLSDLQYELEDAGIGFILMISPDKEQVYGSEYMPDSVLVQEQVGRTEQLIGYLADVMPELKVVYPKESLLAAKGKLQNVASLYYESDTHWNKAGAYIASEELLRAIGEQLGQPYEGRQETFALHGTVEGDLQRMVQLGSSYNSSEYEALHHVNTECVREIRDRNDEAVLKTTECEDEGCLAASVYLSGDSFRWNLAPWLEEGIADFTAGSRYYFSTEDLAEQEPQIFIYMIAERYLHELSMIPGYNTAALPLPAAE